MESGDDGDLSVADSAGDTFRHEANNLRMSVLSIRVNTSLRTRVRLSGDAQFIHRHRQQSHRNAFAGGEQNIHLTFGGFAGNLSSGIEKIVGCIAHCGHDHHHLMPGVVGVNNALGDAFHRCHISNR